MKKVLLGLLLATGFIAKAQVYNNEWIDYSKTYYKFKIGKNGLCRIPQPVLSSAGLGNTLAETLQLWRNGQQIPIYTSVPTGVFSSSDYIEFWGQMNDGKPDKELYRDPSWQLNDHWSLETDTATYFLTVNANSAGNLRLQTTANNVAGTSLPVEPYFMYTTGNYFKNKINPGYGVNVTTYLYSSTYDRGEGWSSNDLVTTYDTSEAHYASNAFVFKNLNAYTGAAPNAQFKIAVSGNLINTRRYLAKINSDSLVGNDINFFTYLVDSSSFSVNKLNSVADTITVFNYTSCNLNNCPPVDRMVIHQYEITYPRRFDFGADSNFVFALNASGAGNYLQISNFSYGSSTPVLYDLTNGKRYVADLTSAPVLKFVLDPSFVQRTLVLVNESAGNTTTIASLQTKNFINYTDASNQGDYLIISNPVLFNGANETNPVNDYKNYRSSPAGGSYNAKIYLTDELVDQFGFGIKKNPAAIRDFLRYARNKYSVVPKQVFIIGKGVNYVDQRANENAPGIDQLNLVPTYGWPASDVLLTADMGSSQPMIPIGRLSVINAVEVALYLKKVKDYEQAQAFQSPLIKDKAWMKNVIHIVGAADEATTSIIAPDMESYRTIIVDSLYGANVTTFIKTSSDAVEQISSTQLNGLFTQGVSLITYFGHSSATTLSFNLDAPENYNNFGKYPLFIGLGCNVGNFFTYNPVRFQIGETLSERWMLTPDKGTIGFVASTHFGIVHYLNIWAGNAYQEICYKNYGKSIGEIMVATSRDVFNSTTEEDFYARANIEETALHGDPAIILNQYPKPDYVIEDSLVKISPNFISVADTAFTVTTTILNSGKAPAKNVVLEIKKQLPNQSVVVVKRDTIPGIFYSKIWTVRIPVNPVTDKGANKIIVTVDPDNSVNEIFENNNSITKDVTVLEDDARPVYPYNFAIVNRQNIKLIASTANPFSKNKQYQMELDTTELFNSSFKITKTVSSVGGLLEFDPGISFTNGTAYYWRTGLVPSSGNIVWNTSSFVYLNNSEAGFSQSHSYQFLKSRYNQIIYDSAANKLKFDSVINNFFIRNAVFPTAATQQADFYVSLNDVPLIGGGCYYDELIINVFNPVTMKPWQNNYSGGTGLYNSLVSQCGAGRGNNFEFLLSTQADRKKIMDFLDTIPDGYFVVVRSNANPSQNGNTYPSTWLQDESAFGVGNSIYTSLRNQGFADIDSFNRPRSWVFMYKKNKSSSFQSKSGFSNSELDKIIVSVNAPSTDSVGYISSPVFGPAKSWKQMLWNGTSSETASTDIATVSVIGYTNTGAADTLLTGISTSQPSVDISSVNAGKYPYLRLYMKNADNINFTPYQLNYWRLTYVPVPEGAVAPNLYFQISDTVDVAQPANINLAFKNISDANFDSLKVKMIVTDKNNVSRVLPPFKQRPLISGDTLRVRGVIDTRQLTGNNILYLEVNPDNDQPEQYLFNNSIYTSFFVRKDTVNPLLDVTFNNVHILNHDLVSSKPTVVIKLMDESKWFLLNDPSSMKVQVRFPDGSLRPYTFGTDTLQFVPATQQTPTNNNSASAILKPYFPVDGEYELIVTGTDMSKNKAGAMEYRVAFDVINTAMISNMLNYPNPFTTSTAFVFTLTGSEVPQNLKIEILTVTGKVVREITKEELGPLHIGRNITEFKWDGTDQYGQKLGNGVYLYRVVTNLNGKSLDKYTSKDDATDKYFTKGYGKMYLMR